VKSGAVALLLGASPMGAGERAGVVVLGGWVARLACVGVLEHAQRLQRLLLGLECWHQGGVIWVIWNTVPALFAPPLRATPSSAWEGPNTTPVGFAPSLPQVKL
jgi:hypothetical protein